MAWPTGMLSITLEQIDRRALEIKRYCTDVRNRAAAGNIPSTTFIDLFITLRKDRVIIAAAAAVPGIIAYAQAQKSNGTLDAVVEFNAMLTAIDNVTAAINNACPKDGSNFLLLRTLGADGPIDRQFTPGQTAALRGVLDTLIAAIN